MPFCPICSAPLQLDARRCTACGAEMSVASGLAPVESLSQQQQALEAYSGIKVVEPQPLLTPALSIFLRAIAIVIAACGLAVAGFFSFGTDRGALVLPVLLLIPMLTVLRRSVLALAGIAVLSVVLGFSSCAANFHWGGG